MNAPPTGLTAKQLEITTAPTPDEDILVRSGGGGSTFSYVTGEYVKRRLLEAFGGDFALSILHHEKYDNEVVVVVLAEYPIYEHSKNGSHMLERRGSIQEVGNCELNSRMKYGDALKTALTDALKRVATHLGIGLDLYHKTQKTKSAPAVKSASNRPKDSQKEASAPAWAQNAQKVIQEENPEHKPRSFGGGADATPSQKGFIMKLLSDTGNAWDIDYLSEVTGFPVEKLGKLGKKDHPDTLPIGKLEASSIIKMLKESIEDAESES